MHCYVQNNINMTDTVIYLGENMLFTEVVALGR